MNFFMFAAFCLGMTAAQELTFTEQLNPIITSITPWFGSVEGGTDITISGSNFQSSGLFTSLQVYVGGGLCRINDYYTTNERIICKTPKCYSPQCLAVTTSGYTNVDVSVLVQSVQGILEDSSTFRYYNTYTPLMYKLYSDSTWGDDTSLMHTRPTTTQLADLDIKIGNYHANLGDDYELNDDEFYKWGATIQYRTPNDMEGGYHNVSLIVSAVDSDPNSIGSGLARTFEDSKTSDYYQDFYNYRSSLAGTVHSVTVFPSVRSVSPKEGSIAGGTVLTITGSGFSRDQSELEVFAGGEPCDILTSEITEITCRTRSNSVVDNQTALHQLMDSEENVLAETKPRAGSPGWWVKMWNYDDIVNNRVGDNDYVRMSFGWRERMYLSLYYQLGSQWFNQLNWDSANSRGEYFEMDMASEFIAPYTGYYRFFMTTDDRGYLYASRDGVEVNEVLIARSYYWARGGEYSKYAEQTSDMIPLDKGEVLYMRARNQNWAGADNIGIAAEITPFFNSNGELAASFTDAVTDSDTQTREAQVISALPERLLYHHSTRESQRLRISFKLEREVQLINITGLDNTADGEFLLRVQRSELTTKLKLSDDTTTIRNALRAAAEEIHRDERECQYFSVSKNVYESSVEIFITIECDIAFATGIEIVDISLSGPSRRKEVSLHRPHTPIPYGSFELVIDGKRTDPISFDARSSTVAFAIKSLDPDYYLVEVSKSGYRYTTTDYIIHFLRPYGHVDSILVDDSGILNYEDKVSTVTTIRNGTTSSLLFDPIPPFMTSVPVSWATAGETQSFVEVFKSSAVRGSDKIDVVKSVCAPPMTKNGSRNDYYINNGDENNCAFGFSTNASARVLSQSLTYLDDQEAEIVITGRDFDISNVSISVGSVPCNISLLTHTRVVCIVSEVPWGEFDVEMDFEGFGYAVIMTTDTLTFTQEVFSVSESVGSYMGGQRLVIEGRGFRSYDAEVLIGGEVCSILEASYSRISCVVPVANPSGIFRRLSAVSSSYKRVRVGPDESKSAMLSDAANVERRKHMKNMIRRRNALERPKVTKRFQDEAIKVRADGDVTSINLASHGGVNHADKTRILLDGMESRHVEFDGMLDIPIPSIDEYTFVGEIKRKIDSSDVEDYIYSVPATELLTDIHDVTPEHSYRFLDAGSAAYSYDFSDLVFSDMLSYSADYSYEMYSNEGYSFGFSDSQLSDFDFSYSMEYSVDDQYESPTGMPSSRPTAMPSEGLNYTLVSITVDGMDAGEYTYSIDATPYLESISPMMVSRATEVNLTFSGVALGGEDPSGVTVSYDGEDCEVFLVSDSMIMCTLPKGLLLDVVEAEIEIYIPNLGYVAKSMDMLLSRPSVMSGFQVYSISPQEGSLLGGTTLNINGFGFFSPHGEHYNVRFAVDAVELPTDYDVLSEALGFAVDNSDSLFCTVHSASFHEIVCGLEKTPMGLEVVDFSVAVGLNGVSTACGSDDCLFTQTQETTPMVFGATDLHVNESGFVFFSLDGMLLDEDGVIAVHLTKMMKEVEEEAGHEHHMGMDGDMDMGGDMSMDDDMDMTSHSGGHMSANGHSSDHQMTNVDVPCWSEVKSDGSVMVWCPPVPAGRWNVSAYVPSLGWVHSNGVSILTDMNTSDVSFDSASGYGSIAGGVVTKITGYGFSRECVENDVMLMVQNAEGTSSFGAHVFKHADGMQMEMDSDSQHSNGAHHGMNFISCSVTELVFYTPSIVDLIPMIEAELPASTTYAYSVSSVGVSVKAKDSMTDVEFKSEVTLSQPFEYSTEYTPVISVAAESGTKSTVPIYYVNLTCPVMMEGDQIIHFIPSMAMTHSKPKKCGPVSTLKSYNFTDSFGTLQYALELSFPLPLLSSTKYLLVVSVSDLGRVHTGSHMPAEFTSLFSVHGMSNPLLTKFPEFPDSSRRLTVDIVPEIHSSLAGGQVVTIVGEGFSDDVDVTVCNDPCVYINSTYSSYQCIVPDRLTINGLYDAENVFEMTPSLSWSFDDLIREVPGVPYGSTGSPDRAFDDGFQTYFSHRTSNCYIGMEAPDGFKYKPHAFHLYPRLQYAHTILATEAVWEGSLDGGSTYITLATVGLVHEGWNTVAPENETLSEQWFTHLRYREPMRQGSSACYIAEMYFEGITASIEDTCEVKVSTPSETSDVVVGSVNYNLTAATPVIFSLSPNNGTALGGTEVEISGINLRKTSDMPTVSFNGIDCDVVSATSTSIVCITRSRLAEEVHPFSIDINVPGLGYAVSPDPLLRFLYIDRWSEATSWRDQRFPRAGDIVRIPEGQVILLDVYTPEFLFVLVQGHLYFDRSRDVSLDSTYIFVYGGYMEIGTADEPYERNAVVTLHGDRFTDIDMPMFGAKCLVVAALGAGTHNHHFNPRPHPPGPDMGQLEVHGLKRLRTWTKLSVTANAGEDFVVTSEPVDFKAGETVVIPGTELPGGADNSHPDYGIEVMTVLSNDDGHHVYFTEPLKFTHRSEIITAEDRVIDLRCEIGLLSRNVIIRGDDRSQGQLFGVHVASIMRAILRIENAEVTRCGQAHNLGRYCTHSHVGMNMAGSYVKANSIHTSFQRTVTTHTTHHWEVRDNVGYNILGHAFFVEFGDETYNHITGNLGIWVKPNSAGLKSDHKPSVFWTAVPTNFWSDNVGVHSRAWGFWFELGGGDICSFNQHLGEFHNMTFRANSQIGLRIYPGWTPQVDPCGPNTAPAPQYLRDMVSYRNGGFGLFTKKMGELHHIGHTLIENGGSEIHIIKFEHVAYTYNPALLNMLLIGTLNPPNHGDYFVPGLAAIHAPQNDFFFIKNSTFLNFGRSPAIATCNSCESGEKFNQGGVQYRTEGLKFVNSTRRIRWMPHFKEIIRDLDGTLVDGPAESYVVRRYFFNDWPGVCDQMDTDVYDYSVVCNKPVRTMRVDNVDPQQLDFTDLLISSNAGVDDVYFLPLHFYGWTIPLVVDHSYQLEWRESETSARILRASFGGKNEYLFEAVDVYERNESARMLYAPYHYDYDAYSFKVNYGSMETVANVTIDLPNVPNFRMGASSYVNETLKVDFSTFGADRNLGADTFRVSAEPQLCPPAGCPVPPPYVPPSEFLLWTNVSIWPNSVLPKEGDDITISADKWVVMNINPPRLGTVTVNGKLSFQTGRGKDSNLTLYAKNIAVYGSFEINFPNRSEDGVADVVLTGDKEASSPVLIGEGIFPGSKVIAVPGILRMVGEKIESTWLRLAATASFGSTQVSVRGIVDDWKIGDTISLSPTGYFTRQGDAWYEDDAEVANGIEKRTINAIYFNVAANISTIHFSEPLSATHLCHTDMDELFCGGVGILSRNVRLSSRDSEDSDSNSFGFGGHIMVMDATVEDNSVGRDLIGTASLEYVQLINFGKRNTDHYGIGYAYTGTDSRNTPTGDNRVLGCAFEDGYNIAVHILGTNGFKMSGNIVYGNWAGGVVVDLTSKNSTVTNNLVVGTRQRPSILSGGYPWTVPLSAFLFESIDLFTAFGNVAAGSFDEGFGLATGLLKVFRAGTADATSVCAITRGEEYNLPSFLSEASWNVFDNEAVGCRSGYTLLTTANSKIRPNDCIVASGIKVWRSGHVGIEGVDMTANILLHRVVLAENHIGTSMSYFKVGAENAYTGIIDSKVIGTFSINGFSDSADSPLSKQTCQVFTFSDPFGLNENRCNSVIGQHYRRVGVLLPQHTNGPKTCATAGRFRCRPSNVPDRLCGMPWQKRFGVPVSMLYSEMHIHNVSFIGFRGNESIPSSAYRSSAIAINPSQVDAQSTVVVSGLRWAEPSDMDGISPRMDEMGRINAESGGTTCSGHWCMGLEMLIVFDQDGTLGQTELLPGYEGGQLSLGSGVFTAPAPQCFPAGYLGSNWQICPSMAGQHGDDVFRQYSAVWRDRESLIIGPITTTRYFGNNDNRTFPSYEPKDDLCALKLSYSRFPLMIASGGRKQRIESTGTIPSVWTMRWDAPSEEDSAIIEFWIHEGGNAGSSVIHVFVGESERGPWNKVDKFDDRYPTQYDPAGSNTRNPQKRTLTVTFRGGKYNFYRFVVQPVVAVTMRMEMEIENFFAANFIVNMATLLQVSIEQIAIADVREGSVIVDFSVSTNNVASSEDEFVDQLEDLNAINALLNASLASGNLSAAMNATILDFASDVPDAPVLLDEEGNFTASPTSVPTLEPTAVPSVVPTMHPTGVPSVSPTTSPSPSPTLDPTQSPTVDPTFAPTVFTSAVKSTDDDTPITEESYFLPVVISGGVIVILIIVVCVCYNCGYCSGVIGGEKVKNDSGSRSGPSVVVGSGAKTRRVSPPDVHKPGPHGGPKPKRVVPTTSANRVPTHVIRNDGDTGLSSGEGLFVSDQSGMDRTESLQQYASRSRVKPGGHFKGQESVSVAGTSMSFDESPADVIRHDDEYNLDQRAVQDEEVELYFDYGTEL